MNPPAATVRPSKTISLLLLGAALCGGCVVLKPPSAAEMQKQTGTIPELGLDRPWRAGVVAEGAAPAVQDNWVATFADPELNALVAEAVANNPDLRVAAVKVEQADAYVRMAQALLRPQINLFGIGGLNAGGGDVSSALHGVSLGVSWEPDLWGRLRYGRNAAQEDAASVAADFEFARQSIAANVAKAWFSATLAGMQQRLTEAMALSKGELLTLAEQRKKIGVGDEQDVSEARADLGYLEDSLLQLRLTQMQSIRALELLLGRYPAAELATPSELPPLPGEIPTGLPLELLERRPDIVAAERRVAAAFDRVGEAKAARLPRLALNASISSLSSDVLQLADDFKNPSAGIGARLVAPLYQGGALKTQVVIRTLEQKEALFAYARSALAALGDVEQALAAGDNLAARTARLQRVVEDNRLSLDLASQEYQVGRGDLRAVHQRELMVESAETALLAVRAAALAERVNLHLALGGGFLPPPETNEPASAEQAAAAPPTR